MTLSESMGGSGRASHDAHLRRKVRAEDGAPGFVDGVRICDGSGFEGMTSDL